MIQIASLVTVQGQTTPTVRNIMTLDQCAPIVGAEVMSFRTEEAMLKVEERMYVCMFGSGHCLYLCALLFRYSVRVRAVF